MTDGILNQSQHFFQASYLLEDLIENLSITDTNPENTDIVLYSVLLVKILHIETFENRFFRFIGKIIFNQITNTVFKKKQTQSCVDR